MYVNQALATVIRETLPAKLLQQVEQLRQEVGRLNQVLKDNRQVSCSYCRRYFANHDYLRCALCLYTACPDCSETRFKCRCTNVCDSHPQRQCSKCKVSLCDRCFGQCAKCKLKFCRSCGCLTIKNGFYHCDQCK